MNGRPAPGWLSIAALALLLGACDRLNPPDQAPRERLIARIDGEPVAYGLFEAYLRDNVNLMEDMTPGPLPHSQEPSSDMSDEVRSRLLDRFLLEHATFIEARKAGLEVAMEELDTFAKAMGLGDFASLHEGSPFTEREYQREYMTDCLLVKKYLDGVVKAVPQATEAEARAYYDRHHELFDVPAGFRLRVIRVDSKKEADAIYQRLSRGQEDFAVVAQSLSEEFDEEQGKDLGLWDTDQLPEELSEGLRALQPGQISSVIGDPDGGFSIYLVDQFVPARTKPFEDLRDELISRLTTRNRAEASSRKIDQIRRQARIEIVHESLGFTYLRPDQLATGQATDTPTPEEGPETDLPDDGGPT